MWFGPENLLKWCILVLFHRFWSKNSEKTQKIAIWRPKRAQVDLKKNFRPFKKKFFFRKKNFFFRKKKFFLMGRNFFFRSIWTRLGLQNMIFWVFSLFFSKNGEIPLKYVIWGTLRDRNHQNKLAIAIFDPVYGTFWGDLSKIIHFQPFFGSKFWIFVHLYRMAGGCPVVKKIENYQKWIFTDLN